MKFKEGDRVRILYEQPGIKGKIGIVSEEQDPEQEFPYLVWVDGLSSGVRNPYPLNENEMELVPQILHHKLMKP